MIPTIVFNINNERKYAQVTYCTNDTRSGFSSVVSFTSYPAMPLRECSASYNLSNDFYRDLNSKVLPSIQALTVLMENHPYPQQL